MTTNKIAPLTTAKERVQQWQQAGDRVVFTNGCFDLLHLGHIDYLEKARALGQRLVVGLNTDASISRLKGPTRPLQPEQDRARLMAALQCVDLVVLFEEDTPLQLIAALLPNVLVKGADYTVETIVGADVVMQAGGTVETITLVEGRSTTALVNKIQGQTQHE